MSQIYRKSDLEVYCTALHTRLSFVGPMRLQRMFFQPLLLLVV
jgi:hypothetical protein